MIVEAIMAEAMVVSVPMVTVATVRASAVTAAVVMMHGGAAGATRAFGVIHECDVGGGEGGGDAGGGEGGSECEDGSRTTVVV